MHNMICYTKAAMERATEVQEGILRAIAKKITWWQATGIIGISDRHTRRWRERYEGVWFWWLFDRRRGKPSPQARTSSFAKNSILLWVTKNGLRRKTLLCAKRDLFLRYN
jgi:hypothetical protein